MPFKVEILPTLWRKYTLSQIHICHLNSPKNIWRLKQRLCQIDAYRILMAKCLWKMITWLVVQGSMNLHHNSKDLLVELKREAWRSLWLQKSKLHLKLKKQIWKTGILCIIICLFLYWVNWRKLLICKLTCLHLEIMQSRILALMEEATSKLNMEKFKKEQQVFNTSSGSSETVFHKNVTQGKVEGSIKVCILYTTSI